MSVSVISQDDTLSSVLLHREPSLSDTSAVSSGNAGGHYSTNATLHQQLSSSSLHLHQTDALQNVDLSGNSISTHRENMSSHQHHLHEQKNSQHTTRDIQARNSYNHADELVQYSDNSSVEGCQQIVVEPYSNVHQESSRLASYSSTDSSQHYTVPSGSDSQQLLGYTDAVQTGTSDVAQFSDTAVQTNGSLQYSDAREGLTQITLPLLAENGLVNLQILGDGLGLDQSNLHASSVILHNEYNGETTADALSVVSGTGDDGSDIGTVARGNVSIIDNREGPATNRNNRTSTAGEENLAYMENGDTSSSGAGVAANQYLQLSGAGGQTVAVPLSFLNTTNGLALLHQLGVVRVEAEQNSIYLPQYTNEGVPSHSHTNNINSAGGIIQSNNSNSLQIIDMNNTQSLMSFEQDLSLPNSSSNNYSIVRTKSVCPTLTTTNSSIIVPGAPTVSTVPTSAVTSPSNKARSRVLGSGPLAISAQGIVQEMGGRRVTVLPRPEDIQRLK